MTLLGYKISGSGLSLDFTQKHLINTINPHSYCIAEKDPTFKEALLASDVLLPDGVGIVWAAKVLLGTRIKKIAGADLHAHLLQQAHQRGLSVFYLGASETTLGKIRERLETEYPNIRCGTYSPPYKPEFSEEDSREMVAQVNAFRPDILFVGMTAPKQEKWAHAHKDQLEAKAIACIGAVFDFYAGTVKRSSPFWISLGLEWLPRFLKEPKRLWRRNMVSTPLFILEVLSFRLFSRGIL
jgi:N-acetylglucosaminyldiphosphoundecaprenol N-acetyl-beta-D-mannosaminyltransferase